MADIFISYKREDQHIAKDLANKLTDEGFSVWWDRNIPAGRAYDEVIEEELTKSKCVIVLWTLNSIASLNVKEEAMEGLKRNILIPVVIGNVKLPYGFKMIQTLPWNNDNEINAEELRELSHQVNRLLNKLHPVINDEINLDTLNQKIKEEIKPKIDDVEKVKMSRLHFTKPNYVTSMINSVVSLKSMEVPVKVYVDGEQVGTLLTNEQLDVSVTPGRHFLQVKGGGAFYGTDKRIMVGPGEDLRLRIGTSITGGLKLSEEK